MLNYRLYIGLTNAMLTGIVFQIFFKFFLSYKMHKNMNKFAQNVHIIIMFNTFEVLQNVTHKIRPVTKLLMGSHWCDVHGNIVFGSILQILPRIKKHIGMKKDSLKMVTNILKKVRLLHSVTCKKYFYSQTSLFVYCSQYLTILVSIVLMFVICHH